MDIKKVFSSGMKGLLSAVIGLVIATLPAVQEWALSFIPEEWAILTIAGVVGFLFNALRNWLKHIGVD